MVTNTQNKWVVLITMTRLLKQDYIQWNNLCWLETFNTSKNSKELHKMRFWLENKNIIVITENKPNTGNIYYTYTFQHVHCSTTSCLQQFSLVRTRNLKWLRTLCCYLSFVYLLLYIHCKFHAYLHVHRHPHSLTKSQKVTVMLIQFHIDSYSTMTIFSEGHKVSLPPNSAQIYSTKTC